MFQKFEYGFIQFNKIFIQLENQGIEHHNDEEPCVCYNETVWDAVSLLYVGATISSCSLPCTTTVAKTKFRFEKVSEGDEIRKMNWIVFVLPEKIRVTATMQKKTSFSQILSDLGGTLGLWLGIGVLQLFQNVATFKLHLVTRPINICKK